MALPSFLTISFAANENNPNLNVVAGVTHIKARSIWENMKTQHISERHASTKETVGSSL
jgi:hypothetical protein